jgi:hypothetical protein
MDVEVATPYMQSQVFPHSGDCSHALILFDWVRPFWRRAVPIPPWCKPPPVRNTPTMPLTLTASP